MDFKESQSETILNLNKQFYLTLDEEIQTTLSLHEYNNAHSLENERVIEIIETINRDYNYDNFDSYLNAMEILNLDEEIFINRLVQCEFFKDCSYNDHLIEL